MRRKGADNLYKAPRSYVAKVVQESSMWPPAPWRWHRARLPPLPMLHARPNAGKTLRGFAVTIFDCLNLILHPALASMHSQKSFDFTEHATPSGHIDANA
jgi:hypothetical protein